MMRFPTIQRPAWAEALVKQNGTYPVTGVDEQRAAVRRDPPPAAPSPAGIQALQQEIAANSARQAEIRVELATLEEAYTAAALLWDTSQLVSARTEMNATADKRRGLTIELGELADDAPRLQARLKAARLALRAQQIDEDLATLPAIVAEYEDLDQEWRELAVELVTMFGDLVRLREGYRATVRRVEDACRETDTQAPPTSLGALRLPLFDDAWLDGAPRSVDAAKLAMGITD